MINAWEKPECMNVIVVVLKQQNNYFTQKFTISFVCFLFNCKPLNFFLPANYEFDLLNDECLFQF